MKSLATKVLAGFMQNLAVVGLILFVPVQSWHYWQAWIFMGVYFIPQLFMIIYFLKYDPVFLQRRTKIGIISESRGVQKLIMFLMKVFMVSTLLASALDHSFSRSHIPIAFVASADALILLGLLFQFRVFLENRFAAAVIELTDGQRVISTGPYALVRHPMYSGAILVNIVTPIALGSWWGSPFALAMSGAIISRLLDEEKFLHQSLPGYGDYCQKVPCRLIPHFW